MFNDYFKTNPGVKDLPLPWIEPQSPSPQPVVKAMSHEDPRGQFRFSNFLNFNFL